MLRNAVSRTTLKAVGQSGNSSGSSDSYHPNLGLHSAAASGNIGLVKFALENGQPANSNFNGILPLHAACSGGSEQSVRMLIFHGADVNSPRLKSKGSTGGPGAEGSTPLHFAAANGHLEIVRILLEAGARPAAADKDGVVPEALALGNGHQQCAQLIRSWISAYGSNGLAGMVSSRDTVSGDGTLGPAGHIRYAAAGSTSSGSNGMASASSTSANNTSSSSQTSRKASSSAASGSGSLRTRRSFEALPSNSKPTSLRSAAAFKKSSIAKTSSNPNLRGQAESTSTSSSTPALPTSSSTAPSPAPAAQPAPSSSMQQFPVISSPVSAFNSLSKPTLIQESPAALEPEEEAELAFASSVVPPAGMPNVSSSSGLRESKRRPSLPSILEKAAHPAASIRAALGNNHHNTGSPNPATISGADSHDLGSLSPGKKANRLGGKRSLSNMLRKATGSSHLPSTSSSNSINTIASSQGGRTGDTANSSINLNTLTKPGRVPGKSFDYQRPVGRRNTGSELSGEDSDPKQPVTAPSHQTTFATPRLPSSTSEANPSNRDFRLRSASSSSSLSSQLPTFDSVETSARTRSSSNEQMPLQVGSRTAVGQAGSRSKASLELLRTGYGTSNNGETAASGSAVASSNSTWLAVQANRKRANSSWSGDPGSSSEMASSDGGSVSHGAGGGGEGHRARSASASSSLGARGMTGRGRIASSSSQDESTDADADDAQEFLVHTDPISPVDDAGEHHDVHHLPEGLRNLTALRQQSSTSDLHTASARSVTTPGFGASSMDAPYGSSTVRQTRNRSGSSLSALSSGSHSGHVHSSGTAAGDAGARSSPNLSAAYQALSIAEENGLGPSPGTPASQQFGRAGSVTDSLGSRPSTSSLRSNYLSAAEQAQAILNQEGPYSSDGPDGTSLSLAAQLAAYGEALALERKRAGEARTGPSPSLSARGSNAALRSKLPSVSEDQSPAKPRLSDPAAGTAAAPGSTGARVGSIGEKRTPNYPATAAQSYNRRVSRRPHSSEGRESRDSSMKRSGQLGAPSAGEVGRAKTITSPVGNTHASLRNLFLEAPRAPGSGMDRAASPSLTTPGLGSPLHAQTQGPWKSERTPSDNGMATPMPPAPTASASSTHALRAGDMQRSPSEDLLRQKRQVPPAVPAKDPARSNASKASRGTSISIGDSSVFEDDPTTPVMSGNQHGGFDVYATSPRSIHRYSPSMPTELSSYATAKQERSPAATLSGSNASLTPPIPPPRKESMNAPDFAPSPYASMTPNSSASGSGFLNPDSAANIGLSSAGTTFRGRFLPAEESHTSSGRWENLRRPSLTMLRGVSSSSSSAHSQSTISHEAGGGGGAGVGGGEDSNSQSLSTAEPGNTTGSTSGSKRRLVRNLLSNIKGTSS